jgi:hypothetical protein
VKKLKKCKKNKKIFCFSLLLPVVLVILQVYRKVSFKRPAKKNFQDWREKWTTAKSKKQPRGISLP